MTYWWENTAEIAALGKWLQGHGLLDDPWELVEKPWHWDDEYKEYQQAMDQGRNLKTFCRCCKKPTTDSFFDKEEIKERVKMGINPYLCIPCQEDPHIKIQDCKHGEE